MQDISETCQPPQWIAGWGPQNTSQEKAKTQRLWQPPASRPEVLIVSPYPEDIQFLRSVFEKIQWRVRSASACREATNVLCFDRPDVIICEWDLPDGSWREILSWIAPLPDPPSLLVASGDLEDTRWAEVLNLGAYDLLAKPFDENEVVRVSSLASLYSARARRDLTASAIPNER